MASYHVFVSFHKEDIDQTNLSYLRNRFRLNGITMFDSVGHAFTQAIRESRISLVVLTEIYFSSYRCLNELVEIFKCKKEMRQIVIPIFYGVGPPSDVKTQTGDFRKVFDKTCAGKTKEEKRRCSQAFSDVVDPDVLGLVLTRVRDGWKIDAEKIEKLVIEVLSRHENEPSSSNRQLVKRKNPKKEEELQEVTPIREPELSSSNKQKRKRERKSQGSTGMALVLISLLLEIASTVVDQLSCINKPYFARISIVMSILSVVLAIIDLNIKVRAHKARFLCKWPIPWFYYPPRRYNIIFGNFADTVLLFCVVGHLIVSTINCSFMERGRDGPIKVTVWPLFFAIGMVISMFMEKPANSEDILPIRKMY